MRIAAYVDLDKHFPSSAFFIKELLCKMGSNGNDTFILLTHQPGFNTNGLPANVSVQVLTNRLMNWPGLKWLNRLLITRILKKWQAELFVTANSFYVNHYPVPCCLIVFGLLQQPVKQNPEQSLKNRLFSTKHPGGKYLYKALQNATETIVFSEYDGLSLQNKFAVPPQKIKLLPIDTTDEIRSLSWVEKENIKIQHTAGEEYFIFAGDIHQRYDLVSLLKAFSQFKKRQQSGMQLIIAGNQTLHTGQLVQKLASFKYRNDVRVIIDPLENTLNALIGAAYAFVYPVLYDHLPVNLLLAIRAGVPVITFFTPVIKEMAGDTVIYTANNAEALSESMQSVYKDEDLRAAVIDSAEKHIVQKGKTALALACRNLFQDMITK